MTSKIRNSIFFTSLFLLIVGISLFGANLGDAPPNATLAIIYGGTGQTSASSALYALGGAPLAGSSSIITVGTLTAGNADAIVSRAQSVTLDIYEAAGDGILTTGNKKAWWIVPACYDNWYIASTHLYACTPSTSGSPAFQVTNVARGVYMYDTLITIDQDAYDSRTASVAAALYANLNVIYNGDMIRLDCSDAGTGTTDLKARLVIQPTP